MPAPFTSLPRIAIACLCGMAATPGWCQASGENRQLLSGSVTRVLDGDTLEVQLGRRHVRVHVNGVDAPEPGQPWGKQAAAALAELALHQTVDLDPVQAEHAGHVKAVVFVGEQEVGAALIGAGNAWADRTELRPSDVGLCEVEASARESRLGLWSLPSQQRIAPWEYRRRFLHPHHTDYSAETAEQCKAVANRKR